MKKKIISIKGIIITNYKYFLKIFITLIFNWYHYKIKKISIIIINKNGN